MTTYAFDGYVVSQNTNSGETNYIYEADLWIVAPEGGGTLSYELVPGTYRGIPDVTIETGAYTFNVNGYWYDAATLDDRRIGLGQIDWSGNATQVIVFSVTPNSFTRHEYIFVLDGTALPEFDSVWEFEVWYDRQVMDEGLALGGWTPGLTVSLGGLDGVTVVEDDVYQGTSGPDSVAGGAGDDALSGGAGDDTLLGDAGDDELFGGPGDDVLDGGAGADVLSGGAGTDTVSYASATRSVRVDLQNPSINYNDASGDTFDGIEVFQTGGTIDQLRGDAAANEFYTGGLSDRLYGRAGDDLLFGEAGADAFYGGLGADVMTGGDDAGRRDRYIYFAMSESGVGDGNRDVITDFVAGEDRIELGRLDADVTRGFKQGFDFVGDAGLSGVAGELAYVHQGGNTIVQADVDGDGAADFEIELTGVMDLTENDFLI